MPQSVPMNIIAHVRTEFPTKFGIPRQSGLVEELGGTVVFEQEYRNSDALRGIEGFSHLWLLWQFSKAVRPTWSPTVRPPRLGGNERMGVFATRSPFRPNAIGLSCVKLKGVEAHSADGPLLHISGADLMDGTPIFDIKPYVPYVDAHPEALGGFAADRPEALLQVAVSEELLAPLPPRRRAALVGVLSCDPRPSYQEDPTRVYGLSFAGFNVRFTVAGEVLTVLEITAEG